jgi:peptidoglycan/LPS O-acetylase OafA/YrhL
VGHLFLVHNIMPSWAQVFDPPMWSVGTEWQIYFFLPFVLLPIWRKFGPVASVLSAFILGYAPHFLRIQNWTFDWACPWYLALFAMGMIGAHITERSLSKWKKPMAGAWFFASIFFLAAAICARACTGIKSDYYAFWIDPIIGLSAVSLIISSASASRQKDTSVFMRKILGLLESKFAVGLGAFSYSLYLVHDLVLHSLGWLIRQHVHNQNLICYSNYLVVFPVMMLSGYLFYLAVERPTMAARKTKVV